MVKKLVTAVIPMYNEEMDIVSCLLSLKKQTYPRLEVILVDDGSKDRSVESAKMIAKKEKLKVNILRQEHGGPGRARNLGVSKAKGKIIIFVDSDMTFNKDYIKNLIEPILKNKKVIGTTHDNELVLNTSNIWSACWGGVRVSPKNAKDVKIFRAIRKKDFVAMGGFDSNYGYADDQTFWFKHKVKPIVAKNTICYHRNPERLKQVFFQSRWIGASLEHHLIKKPVITEIILLLSILLSPFFIVFLSILRTIRLREYSLFFAMIVFVCFRYFGTLSGILRRKYIGVNFR